MRNINDQETFWDTILLDENRDILFGFILLVIGWLAAQVNGVIGGFIGIGLGIYFVKSFLGQFASGPPNYRSAMKSNKIESNQIRSTMQAPITDEPTIGEQIQSIHRQNDFKCPSCGATVLPTDFKCKHCGSVLVATVNLPRPEKWSEVEIGQSVQLQHPKQGKLALHVIHRLYYGELWQAEMKPDVPWTLTGGYYVGLGLTSNIFLMNWQDRLYLLDFHQSLTDMDINRDFAPYARKFAASNQTRNVSFSYQGTSWEMFDIGRFRIEYAEGDGIRVSPGAVGRFIHARRDNRVLMLEDYQSGGSGLDMLWMGYQLAEESVKI